MMREMNEADEIMRMVHDRRRIAKGLLARMNDEIVQLGGKRPREGSDEEEGDW